MSLRPVAFVFFKCISRINFRVFYHHSVSCDLGYDRCGCNGQHLGIPFYDGLLRQNLTYLEQAFCRQAKSFPAWELAQQTKAFPNDVLPYYAEDTLTLKLQELRERYAEPVAPPEPYLVTAEQLDAFVRQTVEQIVSVWKKKENQFS